MRQMKTLTLAIVIVAASAFNVALTSTASAVVLFHASKTGTLKVTGLNSQVFNTGAGTIECKVTGSGRVTAFLTLRLLLLEQYSGCVAFGFAEISSNPADYLVDASNGLVFFDNTVKFELPLAACSISLPPQNLFKESYDNSAGKVIDLSALTGVKSIGSGGLCGGANTTGTWTGNSEIELVGGTIKVQ